VRVRVASFNVRTGLGLDWCRSWPFRRQAVAATLTALDADIVGLQEVHRFQRRWLLGRLPAYDAAGLGRGPRGGGEACPVLTRRGAVRVLDCQTRWYGDAPDTAGTRLVGARSPRVATVCRLAGLADTTAAVEIHVINTHLDEANHENRMRSARQLAGWVDRSVPAIVLGDLNATPDDPVVQALADGAGLGLALPPSDAGGTVHHFTGRTDGRRLDHILVSAHWTVVRAWVDTAGHSGGPASDHWPVAADLELSG
jgi:endonuclease/exonuclease/phosphatase family metal-dependent hydrolase